MSRILFHNATNPVYNSNPGLLNLDQRAVLLAKPGDTVVTRSKFDLDFLTYLTSLGYDFTGVDFLYSEKKEQTYNSIFEEKILFELLKQDSSEFLSTFHLTCLEEKYTKKINKKLYGNVTISKKYGTKSGFRNLAEKIGVPCPKGFEDLNDKEKVLEAILNLKGKAEEIVIKEDEGLGGRASTVLNLNDFFKKFKKETEDLLWEALHRIPQVSKDSGYIVEEWIPEVLSSPSVQIEINSKGKVSIFSSHDQNLSGKYKKYVGCIYPSSGIKKFEKEILADSTKVAEFLRDEGYVGFFGLDLVITENSYYFVEANIRKTATIYPRAASKVIFRDIEDIPYNEKIFTFKNLVGKKFIDIYKALDGILITPENRKYGIFIDFIGTLSTNGRLGLMAFAENHKDRLEMLNEASKVLKELR
jgi:hypothetical protein